MARAVAVTTGTTDELVLTRGTIVGYSIRETGNESGGGIGAAVTIRNGTTASDPAVLLIEVPADGSQTARTPAIDCPDGIFLDRIEGETEVVLFVL